MEDFVVKMHLGACYYSKHGSSSIVFKLGTGTCLLSIENLLRWLISDLCGYILIFHI